MQVWYMNMNMKWFYPTTWRNLKCIFANWNKPDPKGCILYESFQMTFWGRQNYRDEEQWLSKVGNRGRSWLQRAAGVNEGKWPVLYYDCMFCIIITYRLIRNMPCCLTSVSQLHMAIRNIHVARMQVQTDCVPLMAKESLASHTVIQCSLR